jgi:hypothetical protein
VNHSQQGAFNDAQTTLKGHCFAHFLCFGLPLEITTDNRPVGYWHYMVTRNAHHWHNLYHAQEMEVLWKYPVLFVTALINLLPTRVTYRVFELQGAGLQLTILLSALCLNIYSYISPLLWTSYSRGQPKPA